MYNSRKDSAEEAHYSTGWTNLDDPTKEVGNRYA
jgi:hypothetical protein